MVEPLKAIVKELRNDRQAVLLTDTGWEYLVLIPALVKVRVGMDVIVVESPNGPPVVRWGA